MRQDAKSRREEYLCTVPVLFALRAPRDKNLVYREGAKDAKKKGSFLGK